MIYATCGCVLYMRYIAIKKDTVIARWLHDMKATDKDDDVLGWWRYPLAVVMILFIASYILAWWPVLLPWKTILARSGRRPSTQ